MEFQSFSGLKTWSQPAEQCCYHSCGCFYQNSIGSYYSKADEFETRQLSILDLNADYANFGYYVFFHQNYGSEPEIGFAPAAKGSTSDLDYFGNNYSSQLHFCFDWATATDNLKC